MATRVEPTAEYFDRANVPEQIAELWSAWPSLDSETQKLVHAAVSSRSREKMQLAFEMRQARAQLAETVRW